MINTIIEMAKENATSCKMVWGMDDDVDQAFATGTTYNDSHCFCIIGDECFHVTDGENVGEKWKVGDKIENETVIEWLR